MPQDTAFLIYYKDSVFSLSSVEEYNQLPDSLQQPEVWDQLMAQLHYKTSDSIYIVQQNSNTANKESFQPSLLFMWVMALMVFLIIRKANQKDEEQPDYNVDTAPTDLPLTYHGNELHFTAAEMHKPLFKYNSFYRNLTAEKKDLFIQRVQHFIHQKNFYIYANLGYKEMPILIAAAAIQISFGFDEYLLPHFDHIIVHPEEYLATNPLRVLVGNVQGNSISLSWKHFLEDYQNPTDGKNVGLHEMAHALQVQYLFNQARRRNEFKTDFEDYDRVDDEVLHAEKTNPSQLFNENALSNKNEFWATSIEIFFERPALLRQLHPKLYASICLVLNQDLLA